MTKQDLSSRHFQRKLGVLRGAHRTDRIKASAREYPALHTQKILAREPFKGELVCVTA
ncbi:hypothetical protein J2Y48_003985 [Mycoplana sp. BE70]|uniref:hypothetical protein n=1 Tax=Mycoplana sp. BE70 TaxID=2817775 RepID=UPI002860FAE6|nr:hypothetical protein [Mycoplana sp. BE70]MDR6758677.1 hypothetical protein [Mycoplana sp. BE70]